MKGVPSCPNPVSSNSPSVMEQVSRSCSIGAGSTEHTNVNTLSNSWTSFSSRLGEAAGGRVVVGTPPSRRFPALARPRFTYYTCPTCDNGPVGVPEGTPPPSCSGSERTFQHKPTQMKESI